MLAGCHRLEIAEKCELYTAAEIEHIVNEAARSAIERRLPIDESDILKAVNDNPPSLSLEEVEQMRDGIGV